MKAFVYVSILLFNLLFVYGASADPPNTYYMPPQDLGRQATTGAVINPNQSQNQIAKGVSQVSMNGMKELNTLVDTLIKDVDKNIKKNLQQYYQKVTAPIIPIFAGFIVIWLTFQGVKMMVGMPVDIQQVISSFLIMLLIWSIIFSWDSFFPYVAEIFLDDIPQLITEMTGADAKTTLQSFITIIFDSITKAFRDVDTSITNVVSGFFFVLVYSFIFGLACLVCALFFLIWIICKVIIGILIAIAPIFLACALFPASRRYATNWLQAVLTPNVVILLLIISCDLVLSSVVSGIQYLNDQGNTFTGAFCMVIVLFIVFGLFALIPKIAISLVSNGFEASTSMASSLTSSATNVVKHIGGKR